MKATTLLAGLLLLLATATAHAQTETPTDTPTRTPTKTPTITPTAATFTPTPAGVTCEEFIAVDAANVGKLGEDAPACNGGPAGIAVSRSQGLTQTGLARWDTSGLPDNATITSARLGINVFQEYNDDLVNLRGEWHDWPTCDASEFLETVPITALTTSLYNLVPPSSTPPYFWVPLLNIESIDLTGETGIRFGLTPVLTELGAVNIVSFYGTDADNPILDVCYHTNASPTPTPTITPTMATPTITPTPPLTESDCCQCIFALTPVICAPPAGPVGSKSCGVCIPVRDAVCNVGGVCGTPMPTLTATATPRPTRTPTAPFIPTPGQCLGPAICTLNGTFTDNLQLCLPGAGDAGWGPAFNDNLTLIDSLFPNCALEPSHGGTGLAVPPYPGELLVGDTDHHYSLLPPGVISQVLVSDPDAPLKVRWGYPAAVAGIGCPDAALCTSDVDRGKLAIDTSAHKLCVCNGTTRGWDSVTLE